MYILEVSYGCPNEKYPLNGIFQWDQAKALKETGNDVVFVAIDTRSIRRWRKWGYSTRVIKDIPVYEYNFPIGPIAEKFSLWESKRAFTKVLNTIIKEHGKPDVVHVHFSSTARIVVDACLRFEIPYVLTEHSSGINREDLSIDVINPHKEMFQKASGVIAVSSILAKRIKKHFGVEAVVIPNIVDMPVIETHKKRTDYFKIISAGRLDYGKGFDILIDAFKICFERGLKAELTIMGDGPERGNLENRVEEYHMSEHVSFFGEYSREQFADELSDSDVFVLASRGETFGVVYAEALSYGVPVVATKCGGPEDFVNSKNGILVNIDDTYELADAIISTIQKTELYDSAKIAETARTEFSGKCIAEKIIETLKRGIEKNA